MVQVEYLGFLQDVLGCEKEAFIGQNLTPRKIVILIAQKYGGRAKELILADNEVNNSLVILRNGHKVDLDEVLEDDAAISMILPVAGG